MMHPILRQQPGLRRFQHRSKVGWLRNYVASIAREQISRIDGVEFFEGKPSVAGFGQEAWRHG